MTSRTVLLTAALLPCLTTSAQFVVKDAQGQQLTTVSSQQATFTKDSQGQWTIGGQPVAEGMTLTMTPMAERLLNYQAPTHDDYYLSVAGWDKRSQWNLANVHDPTVMRADDGYYYMYQTDASYGNAHDGHGHFHARRSQNLVDWEYLGSTMQTAPTWVADTVNAIRSRMGLEPITQLQLGYWAPCARKVKTGLYRMYYCIVVDNLIKTGEANNADNFDGSWSERALIGVMETSDPASNQWTDKGYVVCSSTDKTANGWSRSSYTNDWNAYFKFNAIDPTYIITPDNEHWLIYGSWHSGFAALQLNGETGKPLNPLGEPWGGNSNYGKLVYTRDRNSRWQGAEAPEVVYRNGWYYLFMAYDGLDVPYNTRVVRARNVDGPYYGIDGTNVTADGGTAYPIMTHPYRFNDSYGWVGISHCAVFSDGQDHWYYASQGRFPANAYNNVYSNAIMLGHIRRIVWTDDDWPIVLPERYGAVPQATIGEEELLGDWENIPLQYSYAEQNISQPVRLMADHTIQSTAWSKEQTWNFDASANTLTIGDDKLLLQRETDWEASPRRATLTYAGLRNYKSAYAQATLWGKKGADVADMTTMICGATDNTAPFWTAFSPYRYLSSGNGEMTFHFTNYSDQGENWNNWLLIVTNGEERATANYKEYAVLRADNFGWGDYATEAQRQSGMTSDYNWDTFRSDMDGSDVVLSVSFSGTTMTMQAVITTTDNKVYHYNYTVSGVPQGPKGAFLTMEKAHLVMHL